MSIGVRAHCDKTKVVDGGGVVGTGLNAEPKEVDEAADVAVGGMSFVEDAIFADHGAGQSLADGEPHPAVANGRNRPADGAAVQEEVVVKSVGPACVPLVEPALDTGQYRLGDDDDAAVDVQVTVAQFGDLYPADVSGAQPVEGNQGDDGGSGGVAGGDGPADRRRLGDDEGRITVWFAVLVPAFLALIGLVVDGGAKVRAYQRADNIAAEAARTGGQAIKAGMAIDGGAKEIDASLASAAVKAYLEDLNGVTGNVTVDGARQLTVTVTVTYNPILLDLFGGGADTTATGRATAILIAQ